MINLTTVLVFTAKVEDHLIPCMWKKNFGLECFGCGMQRSAVLLFQGEFTAAFKMYPAIYTLVLLFGILLLHLKFNFKHGHKIILALFVTNIIIIITNYILKIT